jgi:hypothetical protein
MTSSTRLKYSRREFKTSERKPLQDDPSSINSEISYFVLQCEVHLNQLTELTHSAKYGNRQVHPPAAKGELDSILHENRDGIM